MVDRAVWVLSGRVSSCFDVCLRLVDENLRQNLRNWDTDSDRENRFSVVSVVATMNVLNGLLFNNGSLMAKAKGVA